MVHPLVEEHLRQNVQQMLLNALGIALPVMIALTLAGTAFAPVTHLIAIMIVLRVTMAGMIWLALGVAVLFVAINRFSQVRERTRQFAILKVLGAPFFFIVSLLFQETIIVLIPGVIAIIFLADAVRSLIAYAFPRLFVLKTPYGFWPLSGIVSAVGFFAAGTLSAWIATTQDLLEALSTKSEHVMQGTRRYFHPFGVSSTPVLLESRDFGNVGGFGCPGGARFPHSNRLHVGWGLRINFGAYGSPDRHRRNQGKNRCARGRSRSVHIPRRKGKYPVGN